MTRKKIKIVYKKLGKANAWGRAFQEDKIVELDPRLVGKKLLGTALHEGLHVAVPELSETRVLEAEKLICDMLWKIGFRKVDDRVKQKND